MGELVEGVTGFEEMDAAHEFVWGGSCADWQFWARHEKLGAAVGAGCQRKRRDPC